RGTTSGQFHSPPLICTMLQMGADRILFSTDYPFEEVCDASNWFDGCQISEADKYKIGRQNAIDLFKLRL
ncbi:MAG: amidohydrolase family protein, partial [Clostridiales bacterium]|nr:amidohydrolase family protein [Clostridiales bacterium]